ncbi:MAG: hypothetical protein PVG92_02055 [Holophagae bacterium]
MPKTGTSRAGAPVSGVYDLRFRMWDSPTGGSHLGTEVVVADREVNAGMVTEVIEPGAPPESELCWLEIAVREHDSTGPFTVIGERRALYPTPLANRSAQASSATRASNALSVGQRLLAETLAPHLEKTLESISTESRGQ